MKKIFPLLGFLIFTHILFAFPQDFETFRKQVADLKRDYNAIKNVEFNFYYSEHKWADLNNNIVKINDFHVEVYDGLIKELNNHGFLSEEEANRFNAKQNSRKIYVNDLNNKRNIQHTFGYSSEKWQVLSLTAEKLFDIDNAMIEELYRMNEEKSKTLLSHASHLLREEKSNSNGTSEIKWNWNWLWAVLGAIIIFLLGKSSNKTPTT